MSSATQNCEFCGSPAHIWFNCTKKPDGWKPDRLKNRVGSSAVERQPSKLGVDGSTPSPRSKSTAALTEVQRGTRERSTLVRDVSGTHGSESAKAAGARLGDGSEAPVHQQVPEKAPLAAGTQAPPVDILVEKAVAQAKRRGRPISPNPKSGRAAYQRKLMADRRAAIKAAKETE